MTTKTPLCVAFCSLLLLAAGATRAQDRGLVRVPAPVGPKGETQDLYTGSYALLVGVARYEDSVTWSPLDSINNELLDLEGVLKEHGFAVVRREMNPTGEALHSIVRGFIAQYGFNRGHRLFFFFAGHGHTLEEGDRGFFVPRDAPNPATNEVGFRQVALSMQQISTWAQEITARHALFAFDSCFSGSIFRTREMTVEQRVGRWAVQPVRQFLSAGGAGERVPARSVFTPTVVKALKGEADKDGDGFITGTELGLYVSSEVIGYRTGQTPQFGKIRDPQYDLGDIVFASPRTAAAPVSPSPPVSRADPVSPAESATADARSDAEAVEDALNEYRKAYEARSIDRLLRVYPTLPDSHRASLTQAFEGAREVLVGMSPPRIRITSATEAIATTRLDQTFYPKIGRIQRADPLDATFTLQKVGGRWVIVALK